MHIPDLELCQYSDGPLDAKNWAVPLVGVGWLEHPLEFSTGACAASVLSKLRTMVEQTRSEYRQYRFRGVHICSHCVAQQQPSPPEAGWSQENLLVPGKSTVYAAPGGIVHYIEEHAYLPPPEFLDAVNRCPSVDSLEYREALRLANAGAEPPLETWSESLAKSKAFAEALQERRRATGNAA